ncbi:MAG: chromosome segregation protein SMC [Clostridiales bacterium]|nr:chromosome segregation protein SMC [Clostridiales bacterium]
MYLKQIDIQGFKSFAERIEMQFEKGITAVVGPNGSGKSNISDSIRWVLGEQSPKLLRGSKMEDVIFSGTATRKPVGMAEVSITLDNSLGVLPLDYGEITITRRVYRSGESEYYLNKSTCRLKDIRELLMDTGIGKEGYSIIGQGKIDEILSSKPEDRIQIFEEAAGIIKYKIRKEVAEKKLKKTKDNLLRVQDILRELENQLDPLKRQSSKASKYIELKDGLRKIEVNYFASEISVFKKRLVKKQEQIEELRETGKQVLEDKDRFFNELEKMKEELNENEEQFLNSQNNYYKAKNETDKAKGQIDLHKEKIANCDDEKTRLEKEIEMRIQNEQEANVNLNQKLSQLESVCNQLDNLEINLQNEESDFNRSISYNIDKEGEIENDKSDIIDYMNKIADMKSELNGYKTLIKTMDERIAQIDEESEKTQNKLAMISENTDTFTRDLECVQRDLEKLELDLANLCREDNNLGKELRSKEINLVRIRENANKKIANKNILETMEREHDGFYKGVKNILEACRGNKNLGEGIYGVVADILKAPKGYEIAIETALGAAIQNIVSENEEDAKRIIYYMKKNNLGRITVLPLNTILDRYISNDEKKIINKFNSVKTAYDVVEFSAKYNSVFSNLLARVLIVSNLDEGTKVAKALKYKFKIVTMDGDVINIGGSLTGGSNSKAKMGVLSRKRELEDLRVHIISLSSNIGTTQKELHLLKDRRQLMHYKIEKLKTRKQEYIVKEATLKNKVEQSAKEKSQVHESYERLASEILQLTGVKTETQYKLAKIDQEILVYESKISSIQENISKVKEELNNKKVNIDTLRDGITKLKVEKASLIENKKSILVEVDNLQETIRGREELLNTKREEIKLTKSKRFELEKEMEIIKSDIDILVKKSGTLEMEIEELKSQKSSLIVRENNTRELAQSAEKTIFDLQNNEHKLNLSVTKLDIQKQTVTEKLWEEYELTYEQAMDSIEGNINASKTTREIKIIKNELRELGNVNVEAIEEYKSVKERHGFLYTQQRDLCMAQESLKDIIKEMEKIMKRQFKEQFEIIKKNFNEVFLKLFGGGKADLVITEGDNNLSSGVEIVAQPPGKKLQNLLLLSGGERALTAIALLFAILLVKPSPFCVLDEIEASLDDVNVTRFASFLKELSKDTQFIVVTHRKGTMEIADVLYGVTMQEQGISKLVSVRLTDVDNEIAS